VDNYVKAPVGRNWGKNIVRDRKVLQKGCGSKRAVLTMMIMMVTEIDV
jgi:hypothetical protein